MIRTGETPTKKRGILLEDDSEAPAKRICQENHTALLRRLQDVANDRGSHWAQGLSTGRPSLLLAAQSMPWTHKAVQASGCSCQPVVTSPCWAVPSLCFPSARDGEDAFWTLQLHSACRKAGRKAGDLTAAFGCTRQFKAFYCLENASLAQLST